MCNSKFPRFNTTHSVILPCLHLVCLEEGRVPRQHLGYSFVLQGHPPELGGTSQDLAWGDHAVCNIYFLSPGTDGLALALANCGSTSSKVGFP